MAAHDGGGNFRSRRPTLLGVSNGYVTDGEWGTVLTPIFGAIGAVGARSSGMLSGMSYPGRPSSYTVAPEFAGTAEAGYRLDPAVRDYIVREYQAGQSLRKLAEITGRTHGAVRNVLDRAGIQRRSPGAPRLKR